MTNTNYGLSDGDGNQLTVGLQEHNARKIAQERANELGKSVWLWEMNRGEDDIDEGEEFVPESDDDGEVRLTYSYMADHEAVPASWTGARAKAIDAAVSHLGADDDGDDRYSYYAEETKSRWSVSGDAMAEFGAAVLHGHATAAYSLWCSGCGASEVRS